VLNLFIAVILSVLVIFVAPAFAQNQTQPQTPTWSTYDDPILGISIQYLNGSDIEEEPDLVSFKYGLGAYYEFNTAIVTGQSYYNDSQEMMRSNMNSMRGDVAKINSIENSTLAGKPAYKVDFTSKPDPGTTDPQLLRAINYYMADTENMMGYNIIFRVGEEDYNSYQPIIQRMANSFRVL
jgi:hypothetical protein